MRCEAGWRESLIESEDGKSYNADPGEQDMNNTSEYGPLFKQPSAWIPLVMSLAALMMTLGYAAIFGTVHHQDEGAPAHIFQLIMVAQLPIAAYFALKWLPKRPAQALIVLAVQAVAWIIPIITVMRLESL
jgi:hypothetical protein